MKVLLYSLQYVSDIQYYRLNGEYKSESQRAHSFLLLGYVITLCTECINVQVKNVQRGVYKSNMTYLVKISSLSAWQNRRDFHLKPVQRQKLG